MGDQDQVIALCRRNLDALPCFRSGLYSIVCRRAGKLDGTLGQAFGLRAERLGFLRCRVIPAKGATSVSLLDGPQTWVSVFSCSRFAARTGEADLLLSAAVKNRLVGGMVDAVQQAFFGDDVPLEATDAAVLVTAFHPRTVNQEVLSEWLVRQARAMFAARGRESVTEIKGSGGCRLLAVSFVHCADGE